MPLLILVVMLVVAGVVIIILQSTQKQVKGRLPEQPINNSTETNLNLSPLYISDGKLFKSDSKIGLRQLESHYIKEMKNRVEKSKKNASWKEGTTWDTSFAQMQGMGERPEGGEVQFTSLVRTSQTQILYFLKSSTFGGLFQYDLENDIELRLLHRQNLDYQDLSPANDKGELLLCAGQADGSFHIAKMGVDGEDYQELSGGDTLDAAPFWVWDKPGHVVYQSQGIARDAEGFIKGISPAVINLLDIETGELQTVFSDSDYDYLKPQVSKNGSLYFIRRPYVMEGHGNSNVLVDVLMFPFRLLRAVFHYLNFFSMMYSQKPLTSAGGPKVNEDAKKLIIKGRRVEAEKALRKAQMVQGVPSLVPASWELICCDQDGKQRVLATNVASFNLCEEDRLLFTNGCGVFYIDNEGKHYKLLQDKLVEEAYL